MISREEAQQVFDGVMLSDGACRRPRKLTHNSYFYLNQSFGEEHLDWILRVKAALEALGFSFSDSTPYVELAPGPGRKNRYCSLWSKYSPLATACYHRWYDGTRKVLPDDLVLTPISLANWFMGDGSSESITENLVAANIATHSMKTLEVQTLVTQLGRFGINAHLGLTAGYPVIYVASIDSITQLMNLMEPYMVASFAYKIKIPWRKNDYPTRSRFVGQDYAGQETRGARS